jgi:translocation and assembly module TamB
MLASRPLLRRWLFRAGGIAAVMIAVAMIAVMAATGPLGRWAVLHYMDGKALPRGLVVELDGLSGNVLHRATLQQVTFRDPDGAFLIVRNLSVQWNSFALINGAFDVEAIGASRIEVLRQPALSPSTAGSGSLPALRIGSIAIAELAMHEDVVGEAATFSLRGQARMQGRGQLEANIVRTDREGDRLQGSLAWTPRGELDGSIEAFISGTGPLGMLLRLNGRNAQLSGRMTGSSGQGSGSALLRIADQDAASTEFDWQDGRWSARIDTDGQLLASIRNLPLGLEAQIHASGTLAPFWPDSIDASGAGWQVMANPLDNQRVRADIVVGQPVWTAFTGTSISLDETRWSGTIDLTSGISADGVLQLQSFTALGTNIEAAGGALLFTRNNGQNAVFADLTATSLAFPDGSPITDLPWMSLAFEAHERDNQYEISRLDMQSDAFALTGDVSIDPDGWVAAADTNLTVNDVSQFTDQATGIASADLRIAEASPAGLRLDLTINGAGLQWPQAQLGQLLRDARLTGQIESNYSDWRVSDIRLTSSGALVQGRANGRGANWSTTLDAAVNGDVAIANATLGGGAAIAVEAQGEGLSAAGSAVLSTPQFSVSGREFQRPRLGLEFEVSRERQSADWQLETQTGFGDLRALGAAERSADRVRIVVDEGQLDTFAFAALGAFDSNEISARVTAQDWQIEQGEISNLELTLVRDDTSTRFTANSTGTIRDPYTLSATATLTDERISTRLNGDWAGIPIETIDPLIYRFADDIPEFHGRLATGSGNVRLRWTAENRLRVTVTDLPADILATAGSLPALDGEVGFDLFLRHDDGQWTGDVTAQAEQLRIRQFRMESAVDFDLSGQLEEGLNLTLNVHSDELAGTARLHREGRVSELEQFRTDAPLTGQISLGGAIEPLLALVLGDTRQLAGELSTELVVSGTTYSPRLSGTTEFHDGRYVSEELGISVTNVSAQADWENGALRIRRFYAEDGRNGVLTATGSGGMSDEGWRADAMLDFTSFNAVRRPDLSIVSTGNAEITLNEQAIRIAGIAILDRIDARPPEASAASFAEIDVTEINRPDGGNGQRRRRIPVTLDYHIRADEGIFVSAESFSTEWRGDWHVTGDPASPDIIGDAHLISGRAVLLNRAFRMEEGQVSLIGDPRTAEINLLARHQRDSITVNARVEGPVASPSLTLSSQPALPQDEILARLLFDRNSGQLSPLETATIAAQLSGQNLFGIVGGLRRAAGLDRLDFATAGNGEIRVTGGQQLTDDVYLELESRGAALSSARLEWTLTPDFSLLSRLTGDTQASIALRWRTEY